MNTSEPIFSPQESLNLITEVIAKTRDSIKDQSFCYLLWGWLISTASILFFVLQQYTRFTLFFLPFPILGAIGIFTTVLYFRKRMNTTETYLSYFLNRMWIVLGVGFISVVFINVVHQHTPFTYTLLIAAIGTFVSGLIIRFRPLVAGGATLFAAAIISTYIPGEYVVLLHGVAIIIGYLIPGYMLKYAKDIAIDV